MGAYDSFTIEVGVGPWRWCGDSLAVGLNHAQLRLKSSPTLEIDLFHLGCNCLAETPRSEEISGSRFQN